MIQALPLFIHPIIICHTRVLCTPTRAAWYQVIALLLVIVLMIKLLLIFENQTSYEYSSKTVAKKTKFERVAVCSYKPVYSFLATEHFSICVQTK
jgi:hypothetical protein